MEFINLTKWGLLSNQPFVRENGGEGRKEGFCEKIGPKDSFNVCTKSSPMFSWNFLKAFSNSLETLADGSNDGGPKFGDCHLGKYQE